MCLASEQAVDLGVRTHRHPGASELTGMPGGLCRMPRLTHTKEGQWLLSASPSSIRHQIPLSSESDSTCLRGRRRAPTGLEESTHRAEGEHPQGRRRSKKASQARSLRGGTWLRPGLDLQVHGGPISVKAHPP